MGPTLAWAADQVGGFWQTPKIQKAKAPHSLLVEQRDPGAPVRGVGRAGTEVG
jgi:hypothetical protein